MQNSFTRAVTMENVKLTFIPFWLERNRVVLPVIKYHEHTFSEAGLNIYFIYDTTINQLFHSSGMSCPY